MKRHHLQLYIFTVIIISACNACSSITTNNINNNDNNKQVLSENLCQLKWYQEVERKLRSGDGQGHGPNLGSLEWRSTVEFKLGIRGKAGLPPRESNLWCSYINSHYIDQKS